MKTVVLITKRTNPLFECALENLKRQSDQNFEYIIVDAYWSQRHSLVENIIKSANCEFPIKYIPDKPSRWSGRRPALSSARNTAYLWSDPQSDGLIFYDDCCTLNAVDLVERHGEWMKKGIACAGTWYSLPRVYGWEWRRKGMKKLEWVLCEGSWLHGGNFSVPIRALEGVGLWDEAYDGEIGVDDCDLGIRLSRSGCRVIFDPAIWVVYDTATHSLLQDDHTFKQEWVKECASKSYKPKERLLKDGKMHFSNEWLIERLNENRLRIKPVGNKFDFKELRKKIQELDYRVDEVQEYLKNYIDPDPRDWRDSQLIEEM